MPGGLGLRALLLGGLDGRGETRGRWRPLNLNVYGAGITLFGLGNLEGLLGKLATQADLIVGLEGTDLIPMDGSRPRSTQEVEGLRVVSETHLVFRVGSLFHRDRISKTI